VNQQPVLFDLSEGQRRKQDGIALVTFHGSGWLNRARAAARAIAAKQGKVTSDEVLAVVGHPEREGLHRNSCGAIFQDPGFVLVGYTRTRRPEGHARKIGEWRLR